MAERTGCPVLFSLWSYVTVLTRINLMLEDRKDGRESTGASL
jgi:hypothetical protein